MLHDAETRSSTPGIVFVGGIHGVGKTIFSATLSKQLSIPHRSAGELIAHYRKSTVTADKRVADVDANQGALIRALRGIDHPFLLLDGHFCVLDHSETIQPVPASTFLNLNLVLVIVLYDLASSIQARLFERDGQTYPTELLRNFQAAEIQHATAICMTNSIPFRLSRVCETQETVDFIRAEQPIGGKL